MATATETEPAYQAEHTSRNVLTVRMNVGGEGWEQWFLLRSDAHHDNPHCNQSLERHHLTQAIERGAGIIDTGDLFCAMQGKYDKRSDKSDVRPEHQNGRYLDALVDTASDFYEPFARNWLVMGRGNHEQAIKKRHETDLTERLVGILNNRAGTHIQASGYTGWVRFHFKRGQRSTSRNLWFTHGYGGGGPVTEDMIQSNRQRVYIENADIMTSGHVHRSWLQEFVRMKLNSAGRLERRIGWYVKSATYKDSYDDGHEGFEVERGMGPRPVGAWWLRFYWDHSSGRDEPAIEIIKAS